MSSGFGCTWRALGEATLNEIGKDGDMELVMDMTITSKWELLQIKGISGVPIWSGENRNWKCDFISISLDMELIHTIDDSLTWAAVGTAEFDDNLRVEEAEESQNWRALSPMVTWQVNKRVIATSYQWELG